MKVLLAETMGFCFGVEDAIELARLAAQGEERVHSLGPLIHNQQVIRELEACGLVPVDSVEALDDKPVVIRAHGVSPDTLAAVKRRSLKVIDATCVLVRRAQQAVYSLHQEGYRVVIVGDAEHPEVRAIVGYAPEVTVIAGVEELDRLPKAGRLGVIGQTTLSEQHFAAVVARILLRPFREIKIVNTLCLEVVRRQQAAVDLCNKVDVMFVLGGLHSANTRELAALCRAQGVPTYHLENWESFQMEFVRGRRVAGVTAGASTPDWVITQFVRGLESIENTS